MKYLKGINRDVGPTSQPEGTFRYANNAVFKKEYGAIANENGTTTLTSQSYIIGECALDNGDFILFEEGFTGVLDSISRYNKAGGLISVLLSRVDLNFDREFPISAVAKRISDEYIIYWTDNNNKPGVLNITRQEVANITSVNTLVYGDVSKDINNLSLLSYSGSVPVIPVVKVEEGGNLQTGTYYLALAYMGLDRVTTNYITISNAVYVPGAKDTSSWTNLTGGPSGIASNKQIIFTVQNLNVSFEFLQPVILRRAGGGYDAFKLTAQVIESTTAVVTFSGSENYATASPGEVIIDYPVYDKAKALEIVDSVLYLGNLEGTLDVGYQPYANAIELEAVTKRIVNFEDIEFTQEVLEDNTATALNQQSYRYPSLSYMQKGYTREEVYAFYVVWVLKDGRETFGYHIPGRSSSGSNNELNLVTNPSTIEQKALPDIYNFHLYTNTDNSAYINNMGFWENQDEIYPQGPNYTTLDVAASGAPVASGKPDLAGEKVRHHHFPSNNSCDAISALDPIISNSFSASFSTGVDLIDSVAPQNWNLGDPASVNVRDAFNQVPPMGNRIEITPDTGTIWFEVRDLETDATGMQPYYGGTTWAPGPGITEWDERLGQQNHVEFIDWGTNNVSPSADELAFIAAMNNVGPINYGGLGLLGMSNIPNHPLSSNSFADGWVDRYGYFNMPAGTTVAAAIANPTPHLWNMTVMGNLAWGSPPYVSNASFFSYAYKPGTNDHQSCTNGAGSYFAPYGYPICQNGGSPPCACGYLYTGLPQAIRIKQHFYYKQFYTGATPNYLNYDLTFKVKWVGSGVAQTPTTSGALGGQAPSDVNILGFHLNNVKAPADIADKVQGFRVYRAERDWKNKRVWGQSPAISMRKVGGYNSTTTAYKSVLSPWPVNTVGSGFIPNISDFSMYPDSGAALVYPEGKAAWVRTANPESTSTQYQADHGSLEFNDDPARYEFEYPNSGFSLYDFTLLRKLKNIRPVSYLSLVHYTKNNVFTSENNLGTVANTVHCALEFIPSNNIRFIRNRAITYQGPSDLIGARGLGFTSDIVVGSGFDCTRELLDNGGYTSITVEIAPHDPDHASTTFPSGDETYFNHSGVTSVLGWENNPVWNRFFTKYSQWNTYSSGSPLDDSDFTFGGATTSRLAYRGVSANPIVNLSSLKYNSYSRWNTQKLIQTGYYFNIENFDPRNPTATFSTKALYPEGIFGGDTFICRHGVSTGSMDNYGMVHSTTNAPALEASRSIAPTASFKTHNPPAVRYKSLYCTMVESTDNINFRYDDFDSSNNIYKSWPANSARATVDQALTEDLNGTHGFGYDEVYSLDNDVRYAIALPFIDDTMDKFPNRIIKSNVDSQTRIDANRIFLAANYKDISTSKGSIIALINISNLLYIHCQRSLFATKGKQTVQLTDSSEAFIGSGDIFQQEPGEVLSVDNGYGGLQSIFSGVSTRYGYFFIDKLAGKVFQYNGELTEVSKQGLEKLFKSVAGNPLTEYGFPITQDLIFSGVGATLGYDPEYDRVLVTVHQATPTAGFITGYNYVGPINNSYGDGAVRYYGGGYERWSNDGGSGSWVALAYSDSSYFNYEQFTVSFYPEFKMWGSFHSYQPFMYFNNYVNMFSHPGETGFFFDHKRSSDPGLFYQTITEVPPSPFEFEFVVNPNPEASKVFYNVQYDVHVVSQTAGIEGAPQHNPGFTDFYVYNSKQICQQTLITPLVNSRVVDTSITLNQFRDDTNFTGSLLPNVPMFIDNRAGIINTFYIDATKIDSNRSRFVDKYLIIRLRYTNTTNNLLNLYSANAGYRQNYR